MVTRERLTWRSRTITKTYTELAKLDSFEDRFRYLILKGVVGRETFGFDRYINQRFYTSRQWRQIRQTVIARDLGCDLGVPGYEIHQGIYIHHMNPIKPEDIIEGDPAILDPEYLIAVTHDTHNAIHYGDLTLLSIRALLTERTPGDTKLW